MTIEEAIEILKDDIQEDGGLYGLGWYLNWDPLDNYAVLDGYFNADQLEAIAVYMRAKKPEKK